MRHVVDDANLQFVDVSVETGINEASIIDNLAEKGAFLRADDLAELEEEVEVGVSGSEAVYIRWIEDKLLLRDCIPDIYQTYGKLGKIWVSVEKCTLPQELLHQVLQDHLPQL